MLQVSSTCHEVMFVPQIPFVDLVGQWIVLIGGPERTGVLAPDIDLYVLLVYVRLKYPLEISEIFAFFLIFFS